MKRRADARPERDESSTEPFSGAVAVRAGHLRRVRGSQPAAFGGPPEIRTVVDADVSSIRNRHRLGDVSVLALRAYASNVAAVFLAVSFGSVLTPIFGGC